jgi:membrane-associated phospholipid phosphatase
MASPGVRMASDYNRALAPPVRFAHIALAAIADWFGPLWTALFTTDRRRWAIPLALAPLAFLLVYPFDGLIQSAVRAVTSSLLSGDLRREWESWQQFGAVGSLLFVSAAIFLLDRPRARRLLDLYATSLFALLIYNALKLGIGRPRPKFDDPSTILGPWGAYPLGPDKGVLHAWERGAGSDLWSLPSSHTVAAVILAWFLIRMYPALWPLCAFCAALVGAGRLVFNAHWASDVIVGALLGFAIARAGIDGWWGVRGVDWLWKRFVNPLAVPAYPRLSRGESQPIQG